MFKKFTDTLSGTLDTVKSYGSSMGIGATGAATTTAATSAAGTTTNTTTSAGKFNLNLPVLGNGSVSAPVTTQNSPDPNQKMSLASNTFLGIQNTIGKITGRGESTNVLVAASQQQNRYGRGPALGRAVETNESRITGLHTLEDDEKVSSYHDITSYEQYKKVSDSGQMKQLDSQVDYGLPPPAASNMNGNTPRLVRSNTDEIIDQEFAAAKVNLDDVLDQAEYVDELTPVAPKKDDEDEKPKKKKKKRNKCCQAIIDCIQDNRVKGGCVDPEEMAEAAGGHLVLRKVLNIVFLVVGSLLFAAVVVVIIYTSVVPKPAYLEDHSATTPPFDNSTLAYYDYTVPDMNQYLPPELMRLSEEETMRIGFIKQSLENLAYAEPKN